MEDFHLLGFNIDLPQRTINYMQPSQPWKIRDSTIAGSQRLALSGLQSRLHTIRKYTFPPSSADAAAAELVNLYVQKGHNYHACHRFLKKAPNAATCVCQTLDKGFSTTTLSTLHEQGGREDLQGSAQRSSLQDPRMRKLITSVYLLVLSQAVTPLFHFLFHGSSRFPPHKHSSPAAVQPVRVSAACECQHCSTLLFKLTFPPCCSIAFLPNETIALTENPSSKCVCVTSASHALALGF